eukprot:1155443-Pelagomonas_calceolata.AAC.11
MKEFPNKEHCKNGAQLGQVCPRVARARRACTAQFHSNSTKCIAPVCFPCISQPGTRTKHDARSCTCCLRHAFFLGRF